MVEIYFIYNTAKNTHHRQKIISNTSLTSTNLLKNCDWQPRDSGFVSGENDTNNFLFLFQVRIILR